MMKGYEIDFKGCKTYWDMYEQIINGMGFPAWCGKNPDAIWDMLSSHIRTPAIIYLKGLDGLPKALDEQKDIILAIFGRTHEWYNEIGEYVEIKSV